MSVFENVAYPLRSVKLKDAEIRERTEAVLAVVALRDYAAAYPGQLSGGQQQRVALARAVVANEGVVLFDEPLSNLDAKVRDRLRVELLALHRDIDFSALYVTHDQTEASALGDRIAVMDVGNVAQIGTPPEIYYQPRSRYVAEFIGSANEIEGVLRTWEGPRCVVDTPVGELLATPGSSDELATGSRVAVLFRPEHGRMLRGDEPSGTNQLSCRVDRSMFLGSHVDYVVTAGGSSLLLRSIEGQMLAPGTSVTIALDPDRARVFPA
jgi:iron(III) transport system ATP-binding protein